MDILNFISWTKNGRTVSTVDGANTLVPLGFKDPKRDDGYLAGAISVTDLLALVPTPPPTQAIFANTGNSLYSLLPLANTVDGRYNIAIGQQAGASSSISCVSLGELAGENSSGSAISNFIGQNAGRNASNSINCSFIGKSAGEDAYSTVGCVFIGFEAGVRANGVQYSNFIGIDAGANVTSANDSNFLGRLSGLNAITAYRSNFLGLESGMNSTGNNVNAFGYQAHKGGSLSGQTVFANATVPSYLNRAAATTALTVINGAVAGNTYLYYNQTTFAIEAVRL